MRDCTFETDPSSLHPPVESTVESGLLANLIATLPRHIGEILAAAQGLRVHDCTVAIEGFSVKQYWHARSHLDTGNRWLRTVLVKVFKTHA